ncbi:MAG: transcriptional regulator [Candidatus Nitrosopolaris sp.]
MAHDTRNPPLTSSDSMMHMEQIFFELAGEQRLSILFKLTEHDSKLAKLSKDLNVTMQEVHRNLSRLMDAGLIEKDSAGTFSLTTFGNAIITQISTFGFLSRNRSYFSEHIFGEIPMKFIHRIGALDNSEYVSGLVAVIELWKQLYNRSSKYIYGMLPQIPLDLIEAIMPKIRNEGVKFNYILPEKAIVPKNRSKVLQNSGYQELMRKGVVERRMVDKIQVAVVLSENQATVMFPTLKNETDMNSMFYSSGLQVDNGIFHEWCLDFFRYNWFNSMSFDESKLIEV